MKKTPIFEITEADLAAMPDYTSNYIARNVLRSIRNFVTAPGGKEFLDAKIERMKAEGHPLMQPVPDSDSTAAVGASEV